MPKWLIFYGPKWKCKEFKAATNIEPKILDFSSLRIGAGPTS